MSVQSCKRRKSIQTTPKQTQARDRLKRRLLSIGVFCWVVSFLPTLLFADPVTLKYEIEAYIDGRDILVIQGNKITWNHLNYAAVGRHLGKNEPTIINTYLNNILVLDQNEWLPTWPEDPPAQIRYVASSSTFDALSPSLPQTAMSVTLNPLEARSQLSIYQYPTLSNDFTLMISFDDRGLSSSSWYKCELMIEYEPTTTDSCGLLELADLRDSGKTLYLSYFPDDVEAGQILYSMWYRHSYVEDPLSTIRQGLRQETTIPRSMLCRYVSDYYLDEGEITSDVVKFFYYLSFNPSTAYHAVYYGLSKIQTMASESDPNLTKCDAVFRRMAQLSLTHPQCTQCCFWAMEASGQMADYLAQLESYVQTYPEFSDIYQLILSYQSGELTGRDFALQLRDLNNAPEDPDLYISRTKGSSLQGSNDMYLWDNDPYIRHIGHLHDPTDGVDLDDWWSDKDSSTLTYSQTLTLITNGYSTTQVDKAELIQWLGQQYFNQAYLPDALIDLFYYLSFDRSSAFDSLYWGLSKIPVLTLAEQRLMNLYKADPIMERLAQIALLDVQCAQWCVWAAEDANQASEFLDEISDIVVEYPQYGPIADIIEQYINHELNDYQFAITIKDTNQAVPVIAEASVDPTGNVPELIDLTDSGFYHFENYFPSDSEAGRLLDLWWNRENRIPYNEIEIVELFRRGYRSARTSDSFLIQCLGNYWVWGNTSRTIPDSVMDTFYYLSFDPQSLHHTIYYALSTSQSTQRIDLLSNAKRSLAFRRMAQICLVDPQESGRILWGVANDLQCFLDQINTNVALNPQCESIRNPLVLYAYDEITWTEFQQAIGLIEGPIDEEPIVTETDYINPFYDLYNFLNEQYAFFELKDIDWDEVGDELLPKVEQVTNDDDFALLCMELIAQCQDSHSYLKSGTASVPRAPLPSWDPGFACLEDDQGQAVVFYVDRCSPAEDAGIVPGMIVQEINQVTAEDAVQQTMEEISIYYGYSSERCLRHDAFRTFVRQEQVGSVIPLELQDPNGAPLVVDLAAVQKISYIPRLPVPKFGIDDSANVSWKMLEDDIGYIYIRRIKSDLPDDLDDAVDALTDAQGMIIDVRGNSGGGFDGSVAFVNFDKNAATQRPQFNGPIALLIDSRCISAGEGWASWFIANDRATVFGETTAGASSAKTTTSLLDGKYGVQVSIRGYHGYLDRMIESRGLEPDVPIKPNAADIAVGHDTVLEAAKDFLLGLG